MDADQLILIIASLLAASELLAIIPGIKSNSIFQMIYFILKAIAKAIKEKEV